MFDTSLTMFEPIFIDDTKYMDLRKLVLKQMNQTQLIIGSLETFIDLDNDYEVKFNIKI